MVALALLIVVMTLSSFIFIASEGASAPPTKSIETSYAAEHPPYNFTAIPMEGYVQLKWDSTEPWMAWIFRTDDLISPEAASSYNGIARVILSGGSFQDHDVVEGGSYIYFLEPWSTYRDQYRRVEVGATVPGEPREIRTEISSHRINLTWVVPLSEGGTGVKSFKVYRSVDGGAFGPIAEVGRAEGTWTGAFSSWNTNLFDLGDTNVTPGPSYRYRISAVNEFGEGPYCLDVEAKALPSPRISHLQVLSDSCDKDSILIEWDLDPSEEVPLGFRVYFYRYFPYHTGEGPEKTYLDAEMVRWVEWPSTSVTVEVEADLGIAFRTSAVYDDGSEAFSEIYPTGVGWCEGVGMGYDPLLLILPILFSFIIGLVIVVVILKRR